MRQMKSIPSLSRDISSGDLAALALKNALPLGLIAVILIFTLRNEAFLTLSNFSVILVQVSYVAVVAVPLAMLIISARVDLSVGSVLALGGVIAGLLLTHGSSTFVACLAGIGAGAAVGLFNGVLVGILGLSTIIVTLGTLTAVRGLVLLISPGPLVGLGDGMRNLGQGEFLGVPYLVLIAGGLLVVGGVVLSLAPVGRHIYAIGVNEEASRLSGVHVSRVVLALFVATGAGAGLAGVMLTARLGSAPSGVLGVGFELDVLTAVLLGGVAFAGGSGTMRGVFFGLLFIAILRNGLILENVPSALGSMLTGCVLVIAAALDAFATRGGGRRLRRSDRQNGSPANEAPSVDALAAKGVQNAG